MKYVYAESCRIDRPSEDLKGLLASRGRVMVQQLNAHIVRLGHDLPPGGALNGITRTYSSSSLRSRFRKGAALLCSWAECTTHTAHTRRGVVQRYGQPAPTRRTWVRLLPPLLGEALPYLP
jgi:hypothetical protein